MNRLLAAILLLGACAAAPGRRAPGPSPEETRDTEGIYQKLRSLDTQLNSVDAQAAAPDCAQVQALSTSICALADRICQIADREPSGSLARERCIDGKARCKGAVERTQARGCPRQ